MILQPRDAPKQELCFIIYESDFLPLSLDLHLALLKDRSIPHLFPTLRGMGKEVILCAADYLCADSLLLLAYLDAAYYRPWLRRQQPCKSASEM